MWNSIQARHPKEAAQLSNACAVIRYDPSSPPQPTAQNQHPHHAAQSHAEHPPLARDHLSSFVATYLEPVLPIGPAPEAGLAAEAPAVHNTSARRNIFSRLTGLALLAPQAEAAQHRFATATGPGSSGDTSLANQSLSNSAISSVSVAPAGYRLATRATVRSTDIEPWPMHVAVASGGLATTVQAEAELSRRASNQAEVLRRAQAAFSDLGEVASGRRQAQGVF